FNQLRNMGTVTHFFDPKNGTAFRKILGERQNKPLLLRSNQSKNFGTVARYFDPKNDIAFKKVFGEEQTKPILLNFLNSVLRRKGDDIIENIELVPAELVPQSEDGKKSILDVYCRDKKGHKYIVKMQNKRLNGFIRRIEYYASCAYSNQFFKEKTNQCFLPNISYVFIELPKFDKCKKQLETAEDYWLHFLKEASNELEPPKETPNEIQKAYKILERYRWSAVENFAYEKLMMNILDEEDAASSAKKEGFEEGFEKGLEEVSKKVALKLLKKRSSLQEISDITGLSASKIQELKINNIFQPLNFE
ncbi:14137_t:CDS:2, partial [Dentiscutata erythropus]